MYSSHTVMGRHGSSLLLFRLVTPVILQTCAVAGGRAAGGPDRQTWNGKLVCHRTRHARPEWKELPAAVCPVSARRPASVWTRPVALMPWSGHVLTNLGTLISSQFSAASVIQGTAFASECLTNAPHPSSGEKSHTHSTAFPRRWFNQLCPALKREPFTPQEDALIIQVFPVCTLSLLPPA